MAVTAFAVASSYGDRSHPISHRKHSQIKFHSGRHPRVSDSHQRGAPHAEPLGPLSLDQHRKTGAGLYVQGSRFADEANTTTLPGYAHLDLTRTWVSRVADLGEVEVRLVLRNALD